MLIAILLTIGLAVVGFIPLLGLPGAVLMVASTPVIDAIYGSYAGRAMMARLGDTTWPLALMISLAWPLTIVPAYLATRALFPDASPYAWPQLPVLVGLVAVGSLAIASVMTIVQGRPQRLTDPDRLVQAAGAGHVRAIRRLAPTVLTSGDAAEVGRSALFQAIEQRRDGALDALLDAGVDANSVSPSYGSPLWRACERGRARMIAALLRHGARTAYADADGATRHVVFALGGHGDASEVALLAGAGADFGVRDAKGRTPLMTCFSNPPDAASDVLYATALLDHGVALNAQDALGLTALHHARIRESRQVADLLLRRGADATLRSRDGRLAEQMTYQDMDLSR